MATRVPCSAVAACLAAALALVGVVSVALAGQRPGDYERHSFRYVFVVEGGDLSGLPARIDLDLAAGAEDIRGEIARRTGAAREDVRFAGGSAAVDLMPEVVGGPLEPKRLRLELCRLRLGAEPEVVFDGVLPAAGGWVLVPVEHRRQRAVLAFKERLFEGTGPDEREQRRMHEELGALGNEAPGAPDLGRLIADCRRAREAAAAPRPGEGRSD